MDFTDDQKYDILSSLGTLKVGYRPAKNRTAGISKWYAGFDSLVEIASGGILSGVYGNGNTPEAAIENLWKVVSNQPKSQHLRVSGKGRLRWNGFYFEQVSIDATS